MKKLALALTFALTPIPTEAAKIGDSDDSGTNPAIFTNSFRIRWDHASLTNGATVDTQQLLYAKPLSRSMLFSFRSSNVRITDQNTSATVAGLGDLEATVSWLPYLNSKTGQAFALGLTGFFDTASSNALGTGKNTLGPQLFFVQFLPGNILVAPAVQEKFSISGSRNRRNIHQTLIDLFMVWRSPENKYWAVMNPQIIADHKRGQTSSVVEGELGQMMFGGMSSSIRPGIGIGANRPLDFNLKLIFKIVWR